MTPVLNKLHMRAGAGLVVAALAAASAAAQPAPPKGNHYQCYPAEQVEATKQRVVVLTDQFGKQKAAVIKVTRLCNPVDKRLADGEPGPIVDPNLHLVCYQIDSAQKGQDVRVRNQFGVFVLKVGPARELCLPSSKIKLKDGKG